ncbi:MAG: hypothetical protein A4C66_03245 [Nitrospira sp. HN-bin3]|uniref:hypothetical protein n=1 Tax=Nitrospira cf. moscoviensis SBR1015 TaxID=96242 RepID=UPI000A09B6AB|nr:hypothetical protein [Nitrospira cf. moscoviensis SBR1015]OQW37061.1 MAG: hypothetical protein A4C66_03245 [Nitrospira sp. HN-bin3]
MANTKLAAVGASRSKLITMDTSENDIYLASAPGNAIGSVVLHVEGTAWTGAITPKVRLVGAVEASMGWVNCGYTNLATMADVAAGTAITGTGMYSVRLDHGMELAMDYADTSGSVKVLVHVGVG